LALDTSIPVLVVDDSATIVHLICNLLRDLGFKNIDVAHGGATALAKIKTKHYALIISDWHMAPMNGLDLLRQVRSDPELGKISFLFVTTESHKKKVIEAAEAGADNFIIKPFDASLLKTKIEAMFSV